MGDETGFAGRELSDEFGKTNDLKDTRLWPRPSLIWQFTGVPVQSFGPIVKGQRLIELDGTGRLSY